MPSQKDEWSLLLDRYDRSILIQMLNDYRSEQLKKGEPTEIIDDLLLKVIECKQRKVRDER